MHLLSPIIRKFRIFHAERRLRSSKAVFLAGDSYPKDKAIEVAIRTRLAPLFGSWCGQTGIDKRRNGGRFIKDIPERVDGLRRELESGRRRPGVLFGRSSGARVATLLAAEQPVRAVICLGYPFQKPGEAPEPERYEHLRSISVPTLILQGQADPYGTFEQAKAFPVSRQVHLLPVDTNHEFRVEPEQWDRVAVEIRRFLQEL